MKEIRHFFTLPAKPLRAIKSGNCIKKFGAQARKTVWAAKIPQRKKAALKNYCSCRLFLTLSLDNVNNELRGNIHRVH